MILVVELIWATTAIGTLVLRRIKVELIGFRRDRREAVFLFGAPGMGIDLEVEVLS